MATISNSIQKILFVVTLSLSGNYLLPQTPAFAEPAIPTISVSGMGNATSTPDMAMITLGVQRQAKTARKALKKNNKAMTAVLAALKEQGIAAKDLQTSNFNIQPQYQYFKQSSSGRNQPPKIIGYIVSNQLSVRIRDLSKLGEIIDMTISLGVNSGGNIRFLSDNPGPVIEQARKKAMENAIAKAKTLTGSAGIELGKILTIEESSDLSRPIAMQEMAMARMSAPAAVPIAAGENTYTVNVRVSWELKQ